VLVLTTKERVLYSVMDAVNSIMSCMRTWTLDFIHNTPWIHTQTNQ